MVAEIPFVNLLLSAESAVAVCQEVIRVADLEWDTGSIHVQIPESSGILNLIVKCSKTRETPEQAFILKTYNDYYSHPLQDRHHVSRFLNQSQLGPTNLALLKNGVAMTCVNGQVLKRNDPRCDEETCWKAIAKEMARWHQRKFYYSAMEFGVKFINGLSGSCTRFWDRALSHPMMEKHRAEFPSQTEFLREEKLMREHLVERGELEPCFGHFDVNPSNVLIDESGKVNFIDFDFTGLGYTQTDIVWYFLTILDFENLSFATHPSLEYERKFVEEYLRCRKEFEPELEIASVDFYFDTIQKGKMLVWLRQVASGPTFVDFAENDIFVQYSKDAWKMYLETKARYGIEF